MITSTIEISGDDLSVGRVYEVAVNRAPVSLAESCRGRVEKSWRLIESLVKGNKPVYGVTTGVGPLCNRLLPREKSEALQRNLVRALSAGVGSPLPVEAVRAMMLARANSFLKGQSGVRWSTIGTLVEMLNHGIHPLIPEVASVGASGDLGHLGHMALALMGEGKAEYQGGWMESRQAFQQSGLDPVVLAFKEGLALVNGTGYMTGVGALCVQQAEYLTGLVELCTALLVEVFGRSLAPFDLRIHRVKPYPGQVQAAANIAHFARDSRCTLSLEKLRERLEAQCTDSTEVVVSGEDIQDPYSIRCVPQVTGAVRDHLAFIRQILEIELNSVNDNPLIFAEDEEVAHGGNFLGQHVAFAMDTLSLLLNQLATLIDRQFARLIDSNFNFDLPPMLITSALAEASAGRQV